MCARAGLLIGWDEIAKRALVTHATCDSWNCPECSVHLRERWVLRTQIGYRAILADGRTLFFVTLTSHEKLKTWEATEEVWAHAWGMLYGALKRKDHDLAYLMIPEKHKDGRLHMHAIWTCEVTKRWLKDNARKRGMGYQVEIGSVKNELNAMRYVTKYLGKNLGEEYPKRFRRVRTSQNWAQIPDPCGELTGLRWEYCSTNGALQSVYEECREKGINLIDLNTGEMFDDIDLGTTVYA